MKAPIHYVYNHHHGMIKSYNKGCYCTSTMELRALLAFYALNLVGFCGSELFLGPLAWLARLWIAFLAWYLRKN